MSVDIQMTKMLATTSVRESVSNARYFHHKHLAARKNLSGYELDGYSNIEVRRDYEIAIARIIKRYEAEHL